MKRGWKTWMWGLAALGASVVARADIAYFGPSPQQGAQIGAGAGLVAGILCFLPVFGGCLLAEKVVERKSHRTAVALSSAIFTVLAVGPWLWTLAQPGMDVWLACAAGIILIALLYFLFRVFADRIAWKSWVLVVMSVFLLACGIASCASFGFTTQKKSLDAWNRQRRRNLPGRRETTALQALDYYEGEAGGAGE